MKKPLFWIGVVSVMFGIFQTTSPYLHTHYLKEDEIIGVDLPETVHEGEVYDGYVPSTEKQRREIWEKRIQEVLVSDFEMSTKEADEVISKMQEMDVPNACGYLESEYGYYGAYDYYDMAAYHKGTDEEINSYLINKLEEHTFSYYFSRKFADFASLYMGFFATVLLSMLFMQDTRKNTYELLHTKPVRAANYMLGKIGGGFLVCILILGMLNIVFWSLCLIYTRNSGFEVRLLDFLSSTCFYILPNMLMIVSVYALIAMIFKNPLPAVPIFILYMVYSNLGSRNAQGVYGYYGRPLAIMVRFPGQFFDVTPPPMAMLNQSFLILASIIIFFISVQLWKRRRI